MTNSKCIKGSTHYQGDKQEFDVSSQGLRRQLVQKVPTKGLCSKRRILVYRVVKAVSQSFDTNAGYYHLPRV